MLRFGGDVFWRSKISCYIDFFFSPAFCSDMSFFILTIWLDWKIFVRKFMVVEKSPYSWLLSIMCKEYIGWGSFCFMYLVRSWYLCFKLDWFVQSKIIDMWHKWVHKSSFHIFMYIIVQFFCEVMYGVCTLKGYSHFVCLKNSWSCILLGYVV